MVSLLAGLPLAAVQFVTGLERGAGPAAFFRAGEPGDRFLVVLSRADDFIRAMNCWREHLLPVTMAHLSADAQRENQRGGEQ